MLSPMWEVRGELDPDGTLRGVAIKQGNGSFHTNAGHVRTEVITARQNAMGSRGRGKMPPEGMLMEPGRTADSSLVEMR